QENEPNLTTNSEPGLIIRSMMAENSGLDIRDRTWLKITVPQSFLGVDLVDWLYTNVEGFTDRHQVKKFADNMLKNGYIRHTVKKTSFSEQCCYIFGD
ncbi:uncharacterized protein TRIADDRAFT_17877, partial [Trichoplax adhaerens]